MKRGGSAISRRGTSEGGRPAATTSRTSVFRVITPTSRPSVSTTNTARTSSRSAKHAPSCCALSSARNIVGSGTISNADRATGISCLAEQRTLETLDTGKPITPFMKHGDTVAIEMFGADGASLFGRIDQKVVPA